MMAEVLNSSEEVSIDDETIWTAITPGARLRKYIKKDTSLLQEPSCSDTLSDEEDCCPRSSSPELEVLEHVKNKSHITVDLTLEDDDCQVEASVIPAKINVNLSQDKSNERIKGPSSNDVLEISDDEESPPPAKSDSTTSESSSSLGSLSLPLPVFRNNMGESSYKKPKLAWKTTFDGEADTLSLLMELESSANLPRSSDNLFNPYDAGLSTHSTISTSDIAPVSTGTLSPWSVPPSSTSLSRSGAYSSETLTKTSRESSIAQLNIIPQDHNSSSSATGLPSVIRGISAYSSSAFTVPILDTTITDSELDQIVSSIVEADLAIDLGLSSKNSAFQTVNPGTSRSQSVDFAISNGSGGAVNASTSATIWNAVQPSTSMCNQNSFSNSSQNTWYPNSHYSTNNGSFSGFPQYGQINNNGATTPAVENGFVNGTASVNSQQGFLFAKTGSSTSAFKSVPHQSSVYSDQPNGSITSVSQMFTYPQISSCSTSSFTNVPSSLTVSSSFSNEVVTDAMTAQSLFDTYLRSENIMAAENETLGNSFTDDKISDKDNKTTENSYIDPPSPEGPTISCHICLDSVKTIQSSSRNLCSTVCGHIFCSDCLESSLKHKKECPMCRRKLNKKQYHPLFL